MSQPSLPHTTQEYHDKNTIIQHKKKKRHQKDTINEEYRFKIEVNSGKMHLFMQKDGQRRLQIKQESQVRSLTVDIIIKLLSFMDFEMDQFKQLKKLKIK